MRREHKAIILVLLGLLLLALGCTPALAADACSVKQAKRDVRAAKQSYVRAAGEYREAKRILAETKHYSELYRADVGRWVRLARRCEWTWGDIPWLMRQMEQESKGQPVPEGSRNGILQCEPYWWSVDADPNAADFWESKKLSFPWDATSPKQTFIHARVMDKSNWWIIGEGGD